MAILRLFCQPLSKPLFPWTPGAGLETRISGFLVNGAFPRFRPNGLFYLLIGIVQKVFSEKASAIAEMHQKCVRNASKWVLFYWERRNVPKCVGIASKLRQKCVKNAFGGGTPFGRFRLENPPENILDLYAPIASDAFQLSLVQHGPASLGCDEEEISEEQRLFTE